MKLLADTHAFLWFVTGDSSLSRRARQMLSRDAAEVYLSAASIWELAIKSSLGRLTLPEPLDQYLASKVAEGYHILSIDGTHAAAVETLPFHHRDPFDRLLIAQALTERVPVVTGDRVFTKYGVDVVW